jgi:hypothetical protein
MSGSHPELRTERDQGCRADSNDASQKPGTERLVGKLKL